MKLAQPFSPNWKMDRKTSALYSPTIMEINDHNNADYLFRTIILGESECGKTALIRSLLSGTTGCQGDTFNQVLVDHVYKLLPIVDVRKDRRFICLDIADPCVRYAAYKPIVKRYYPRRAVCFLVFDVTRRSSLEKLTSWVQDYKHHGHSKTLYVVVGNKCDLKDKRIVSTEEGEQFAKTVCGSQAMYFEMSAMTGENVYTGFAAAATRLYERMADGVYGPRALYEDAYNNGIKCQKVVQQTAYTSPLLPDVKRKKDLTPRWLVCLGGCQLL